MIGVSDATCLLIGGWTAVSLTRARVSRWTLMLALMTLVLAVAIWGQWWTGHAVAQLAASIVATCLLPGYLVLELALPSLARQLDRWERAPLLFSLAMGIWTAVAAVTYRLQPLADLVIGFLLIAESIAVVILWRRVPTDDPPSIGLEPDPARSRRYFVACLSVAIIGVAVAASVTARFQRYDFDSSFHLGGFNKIAMGDRVVGGNAFAGPQYSTLLHYAANPGYLAFGLTARLARTSVTWLYPSLVGLLTPLFFLSLYSLVNVFTRNRWIATVAVILAIGPWVATNALLWGPPTGTFLLQFLPDPGSYTQLILIPVWLTFTLRYVSSQDWESWGASAALALAAMGHHAMGLFVVPYTMCLVLVASITKRSQTSSRLRSLALAAVGVLTAGVLAYLVTHPVGMDAWKGIGYREDTDAHLKTLLRQAWVLSSTHYAVHPKLLLTATNLLQVAGVLAMVVLIWSSRLSGAVSRSNEAVGGLPPPALVPTRSALAVAVALVWIGPFLVVCNPILVPLLVEALHSPLPISRMVDQNEVFALACQYGALASAFWAARLMVRGRSFERLYNVSLAVAITWFGIVSPLIPRQVLDTIARMFKDDRPSIVRLTDDPLYAGMARLPKGIVAIDMRNAEYLVMTTHHHVMSSTRMTKQRQDDNQLIVQFGAPVDLVQHLVRQYDCRYVVASLDANRLPDGGFELGTWAWSETVASQIESVPGGQSGRALALTRRSHGSQTTVSNFSVEIGKTYRLEGFVKSGTSGDEPFAIQIYGANSSGQVQAAIEGRTSNTWTLHATSFKATASELSVVLRKDSPTDGSMLFDSINLSESAPGGLPVANASSRFGPAGRFRDHPELFREVMTVADHAVFEVK